MPSTEPFRCAPPRGARARASWLNPGRRHGRGVWSALAGLAMVPAGGRLRWRELQRRHRDARAVRRAGPVGVDERGDLPAARARMTRRCPSTSSRMPFRRRAAGVLRYSSPSSRRRRVTRRRLAASSCSSAAISSRRRRTSASWRSSQPTRLAEHLAPARGARVAVMPLLAQRGPRLLGLQQLPELVEADAQQLLEPQRVAQALRRRARRRGGGGPDSRSPSLGRSPISS